MKTDFSWLPSMPSWKTVFPPMAGAVAGTLFSSYHPVIQVIVSTAVYAGTHYFTHTYPEPTLKSANFAIVISNPEEITQTETSTISPAKQSYLQNLFRYASYYFPESITSKILIGALFRTLLETLSVPPLMQNLLFNLLASYYSSQQKNSPAALTLHSGQLLAFLLQFVGKLSPQQIRATLQYLGMPAQQAADSAAAILQNNTATDVRDRLLQIRDSLCGNAPLCVTQNFSLTTTISNQIVAMSAKNPNSFFDTVKTKTLPKIIQGLQTIPQPYGNSNNTFSIAACPAPQSDISIGIVSGGGAFSPELQNLFLQLVTKFCKNPSHFDWSNPPNFVIYIGLGAFLTLFLTFCAGCYFCCCKPKVVPLTRQERQALELKEGKNHSVFSQRVPTQEELQNVALKKVDPTNKDAAIEKIEKKQKAEIAELLKKAQLPLVTHPTPANPEPTSANSSGDTPTPLTPH